MQLNIITLVENTLLCLSGVDKISDFRVSPDGSLAAISLPKDGLFVVGYDPEAFRNIYSKEDLKTRGNVCNTFPYLRKNYPGTDAVRWGKDNKSLAVIARDTLIGKPVEIIQILKSVDQCGGKYQIAKRWPKEDFGNALPGLTDFYDFAWDGSNLFTVSVDEAGGFGKIYEINLETGKAENIEPINGRPHYYRAFQWSPDGQWFIFVFKDSQTGEVKAYYDLYSNIGTTANLFQLQFADKIANLELNPQLQTIEHLEPVFRPVK